MLRAVPATMRLTESRRLVFISFILVSAISVTCASVSFFVSLVLFGSPEPLAIFAQEKTQSSNENDLQTKKAWDQFKGGFFVGACGSAGFAFICLSSIPTFTAG